MASLRIRIMDRSVLQLIRLWLESPVVEGAGSSCGPEKWSRAGGVISPLLSNLYLFWSINCFVQAVRRRRRKPNWCGMWGQGADAVSDRVSVGQGTEEGLGKGKGMTWPSQCFKPIPKLIQRLNRQLDGWELLPIRVPAARLPGGPSVRRTGAATMTISNKLGLRYLLRCSAEPPAHSCNVELSGEPDAGNLHVRFDGGRAGPHVVVSFALLLP